jgi:hypothetical protein
MAALKTERIYFLLGYRDFGQQYHLRTVTIRLFWTMPAPVFLPGHLSGACPDWVPRGWGKILNFFIFIWGVNFDPLALHHCMEM